MRSANPALNAQVFTKSRGTADGAMTLNGTVNKAAVLLFLVVISAALTWDKVRMGDPNLMPWLLGGMIGGLVMSIATIWKPHWAPRTAPLYAACQGLFLGVVSAFFERMYPGIVVQAVGLTFGTLFALLAAYRSGLIKATENFKLGVFAATGAIGIIYLVSMVLNSFGTEMPYIHKSGLIGIGFSAFVVVIAALNLVLDFDFIEQGCDTGAPKYMEWYAAFGLMVTLIWLYLEFLRLLSKLRSR
ncbi:MAG: Bax inhibitor-1/YccA family protein [Pedosphaera sp.]|nr:Bax inhibitor-1/YccA family protein [Pedosphaera sp.]